MGSKKERNTMSTGDILKHELINRKETIWKKKCWCKDFFLKLVNLYKIIQENKAC